MKPRLLLIIGAVALFAGATVLAAALTDRAVEDVGAALPPAVTGDIAPLVAGEVVLDAEAAVAVIPAEGLGPTEAIGGYAPVDSPSPADPVHLTERGYPWLVGDLAEFAPSLDFDPGRYPAVRFIDYCAEAPGDLLCPAGVGGTVLVPFDLTWGDFTLWDHLVINHPEICVPEVELGQTEHSLGVGASHPARVEVTYAPVGLLDDTTTVVIDHTDATDPLHLDWLEQRFARPDSVPNVVHCFAIDVGGYDTWQIDVHATSFTGETASRTYTFYPERRRPPLVVQPEANNEASVYAYVRSDPEQRSIVRLIPEDEGATCGDIEEAVLSGDRSTVVGAVLGPARGWYEGRTLTRDLFGFTMTDMPGYRYDPAYEAIESWHVTLEEGTNYRLCVWWVGSGRSFDPAAMSVEERVEMMLQTPDRLRATIGVMSMAAPSDTDLAAPGPSGMRLIVPDCPTGVHAVPVPPRDVARGTEVGVADGGLCDYAGLVQPIVTRLVLQEGGRTLREWLLPTPTMGEPGTEDLRLDLTAESSAGMCGGDFGRCSPPTTTITGPVALIRIIRYQGSSNGVTDWVIGGEAHFEAPAAGPVVLPTDIQIDLWGSGVAANDPHSVLVTAVFDRPVTLAARLADRDWEWCLTGPAPSYASGEPSEAHSFVLDGLCPLTGYEVYLEATDASGTTTAFDHAEGVPHPWLGFGSTAGYEVTYTVSAGTALRGYEVEGLTIEVGGMRLAFTAAGDCATEIDVAGPVEAVWGEEVPIRVSARFRRADIVDGRCVGVALAESGDIEWHLNGSATAAFSSSVGRTLLEVPLRRTRDGVVSSHVLRVSIEPTRR